MSGELLIGEGNPAHMHTHTLQEPKTGHCNMKVKPLETASHENLPLSSLLFPAAKKY